MSERPSARASRVLAAILRIGRTLKRQTGSHRTLSRPGWPDVVFAFHDGEEICPRMLARIAKKTGLTADDL
jgi:predicted RNA binding protein YcfA (HicA-like mRNA interferase family)